MSITPEAAKSLAVAYQAWCEAVSDERLNSMKVWAGTLTRAQEATGVVLRDPADMQRAIANLERVKEAA